MDTLQNFTQRTDKQMTDNLEHLKIELGDVLWYVAQACMALEISFEEVADKNIDKLSKRYPDGHFDSYYSENRKKGDR